jgi:hypothetical protein
MRVVSGIQPTGNLHLGNYLGAIRNWVRMQDELPEGGQCLFFLADLHAISMPHEPAQLASSTREMVAALVACGIDPARSILFNQAQVPAHAELEWLLNGTARMGWLNRMTQWKDKAGKNREGQSVALFSYPVLQAADVLLYQATHVPVGEEEQAFAARLHLVLHPHPVADRAEIVAEVEVAGGLDAGNDAHGDGLYRIRIGDGSPLGGLKVLVQARHRQAARPRAVRCGAVRSKVAVRSMEAPISHSERCESPTRRGRPPAWEGVCA